ncbi:MAG: ribose-phosphate pyrophosphokinase [Anaerolineae bacterium]|nr:ribose-phosphate pyrophosphokinase [Anaerolineae bacterium]
MYGTMRLFSGRANLPLAQRISEYLKVSLDEAEIFEFPNENIFVRLKRSVRAQDVFLIQPTCSPVNRNIMELLIMIDTLKRASAGRITAVIPYYGYGRTDKKDQPRVPITARLIADMITVAGANRVLTVDLHAGQIQGFFSIPVDEMTAMPLLVRHFREKGIANPVIVAPDVGATKRARNFAQALDAPLVVIEKRRVENRPTARVLNLIGRVRGKNAIIVDDEIDTGGSLAGAFEILRRRGAQEIYACATHGVFSPPAVERLSALGFAEIVVTDTVLIPPEKQMPHLKVLSVAPLLGEVIRRIHTGESVGAMALA